MKNTVTLAVIGFIIGLGVALCCAESVKQMVGVCLICTGIGAIFDYILDLYAHV